MIRESTAVSVVDLSYQYRCRGTPPTISCLVGQPDVDLLKQVEQVTNIDFGRTGRRSVRIPSMGIADAVEALVFLIRQLLDWPLFGCRKQPGGGPRAAVCEAAGPLQRRSGIPPVKLTHYP